MYLERFTINNFRKFGNKDNTVCFVNASPMKANDSAMQAPSVIAPSSTLIIGKNNAGKTTVITALNFVCSKRKPKPSDFNVDYLKDLLSSYKLAIAAGSELDDLQTPELTFVMRVKISLTGKESDLVNNLYQFISISDESDSVEITVKYRLNEQKVFRDRVISILEDDYSKIEGLKTESGNAENLLVGEIAKEMAQQEPDKTTCANDELKMLNEKLIFNRQRERVSDLLSEELTEFSIIYLNSSNVEVKDPNLSRLFNVKEIKANRHLKSGVLSDIYKNIVSFQYSNDDHSKDLIRKSIIDINKQITASVSSKSESISSILRQLEQANHVGVSLSGDVTEEMVLKNLIKYSFSDGEDFIPEDQFGLGYINLLNIIGEIIHYIDQYEDGSHQNQINLLFIEEPEAFMHPQMQEFFITRIDSAVQKVLQIANANTGKSLKSLYCQLVITTHSSHIVNSKIHSSNSFNNINYLHSVKRNASVVKLDDELVAGSGGLANSDALKFIKKHIKYKVSELFFSDAVIFVEGITEETLFHHYLDQNSRLRNFYISVFNINGAHGKLYFPLAKALQVPCLVVTDIDIKREKCEKGEKNDSHQEAIACNICGKKAGAKALKSYLQITNLDNRITTNSTLIEFNKKLRKKDDTNAQLLAGIDYFEDENLHIVFQKEEIKGQYSTSFEEAFILTNYENDILNSVLANCKPEIYKSIVGYSDKTDRSKIINNSFKLQKKLEDKKSDFANSLLYECIINSDSLQPKLPPYIEDGFKWLEGKLLQKIEGANTNANT